MAISTALLGDHFQSLRVVYYVIGIVTTWAYWLIASVGVWRSSNHYKGNVRIGPIAKVIVVVMGLFFVYALIDGGAVGIINLLRG